MSELELLGESVRIETAVVEAVYSAEALAEDLQRRVEEAMRGLDSRE